MENSSISQCELCGRTPVYKTDGLSRWICSRCANNVHDPIRRADKRVGRNDPCPCGSGKKYKRCCQSKTGRLLTVGPPQLNTLPSGSLMPWLPPAGQEPIKVLPPVIDLTPVVGDGPAC